MKKYVKILIILTLCFAVSAAAAFAAFEFGSRLHRGGKETTEPKVTDISGRVIPNHTDVAKSALSPDGFVRDGSGRRGVRQRQSSRERRLLQRYGGV